MFDSLIRLACAPVRIVDALVVEPLADIAEDIANGIDEVTGR